MDFPRDLLNEVDEPEDEPIRLKPSRRRELRDPKNYRPGARLVDAVRVALLLRKPLLVTGEPGTGKTELGHYLAWKMRMPCFQFNAKSNSVAENLYYTYDALGRFQAKQSGEAADGVSSYLRFNAMGEALLRASEWPEELKRVLPPVERRQSVVVIDEIDKAPRDFPNDLLNELDQKYFVLPMLGNAKIQALAEEEPVVIVTSNSEKNLPPPFLRRCVYCHIDFPSVDELRAIASDRVAEFKGSAALEDALKVFSTLRSPATALQKPPGTGELLDWLLAMALQQVRVKDSLKEQKALVTQCLPALVKQAVDRASAEAAVESALQ